MTSEKNNKIIPLPNLDKRPINKPIKGKKESSEEEQEMLDFLGSLLNEVASEEENNHDNPLLNLRDKDKRRTKIIDRPKPDPHKTINLNEHRKK